MSRSAQTGVDQLFVAEVLDDLGLGVHDGRGAAEWTENQMLRPIAGDERAARRADRLTELRRNGDGHAGSGQGDAVAAATDLDRDEVQSPGCR